MCSTACNSEKSDDFPVDDVFEEIDLSNGETIQVEIAQKDKDS